MSLLFCLQARWYASSAAQRGAERLALCSLEGEAQSVAVFLRRVCSPSKVQSILTQPGQDSHTAPTQSRVAAEERRMNTESPEDMSGLGEVFLCPSLAGLLGMQRKCCGRGRELRASGRRTWRFPGKAWCGPEWREPKHRTLGCGMAASELPFTFSPFAVRCCQKRHFGWLCLTPQGRACSYPAASSSEGRLT